MLQLSSEIKNIVESENFGFFGIGNLDDYSVQLMDYGYEIAEGYKRSISIGLALSNAIVDELIPDSQFPTIELYRHFCYDLVNQRIDNTLLKISEILSKNGYDSLPIPASKATDKQRLFGSFSHKAAAYISGLGWIGKSCLLITESAGPRVRWGTILTNAPLSPTGKPTEKNCGSCNVCVQNCPAEAFTGAKFNTEEKREVRYDAYKCDAYLSEREKKNGLRVCGICIQVCPFGKKHKLKQTIV